MLDASMLLGMILGAFGALILGCFGAGAVIFAIIMRNRDLKYRIRIRNFTGGKATVDLYWAKRINDPSFGECYFIPNLKREKRAFLPYLGSNYEYPLEGKKFMVEFTYFNGEYTPEEYAPTYEEEREVIKEVDGVFKRIKEKVTIFVLRPVPKSIRKWVIDMDRKNNQENAALQSWWDKNKELIVTLAVLVVLSGVTFIVNVLGYNHADKALQMSYQLCAPFMNATLPGVAPPV